MVLVHASELGSKVQARILAVIEGKIEELGETGGKSIDLYSRDPSKIEDTMYVQVKGKEFEIRLELSSIIVKAGIARTK